jgi:hypothetical protein
MKARIYKTGKMLLVLGIISGSAIAILGLFGIVAYFTSRIRDYPVGTAGVWFPLCFVVISMGIWAAVELATSRVVLYSDAIEVRSLFRYRRLERCDIGAKTLIHAVVPIYYLYPWSKKQRILSVSVNFSPDETFISWFVGIPDADKKFFRARRDGTLEPST